jgi:nitric oxide reductase subunit B
MSVTKTIDQRKNWWKIFVIIFAVSVSVVGYIGFKTYQYAPPISDFVDEDGKLIFAAEDITAGQQVFFTQGLMEYGSFLGDGGMRGPDFTGEALNFTAKAMNEHYDAAWREKFPDAETRKAMVTSLVQKEIKKNRYDAAYYTRRGETKQHRYQPGAVIVSAAQAQAFRQLNEYYKQMFGEGGTLAGKEEFKPANYIADPEKVRQLSAFFYWGGWLCGAERPGYGHSYTHNWPYDPLAGNTPHGGLVFWSAVGVLILIFSIGGLFYYYGKMDLQEAREQQQSRMPPLATTDTVDRFKPTPTQRATYKFFAVAALLFLIQVLAGVMTVADFIGLSAALGIPLQWLPVTVVRGWHSQISILWISVCWFAATIWVLPLICRPEPRGQLKWINALFWMLIVTALGGTLGIPLGIKGLLSEINTRWFGIQGWEFLQIGRFYQYLLFAAFAAWGIIVFRGVWPALRQKQSWSLPNWMVYMIAGIIFMFCASFVAKPDTNFVIADFWRWCTVHMWVEAFFELFTTVLVAYFMYLMGFVSHLMAARVVYFGAVLFLGSGLIGIAHNFYWNAKSIETIALGGVLSSLQIAPLVLLTVEAYRFRNMPESTLYKLRQQSGGNATFGLAEAFLFLVGVNFWNFFGAGVLGFMINLPIINYYQHGTYLTVNHGHAALMGVYGNLAIATMLFCGRWNLHPNQWAPHLLRTSFWSLNLGLALMCVMDLFPKGIHQLMVVMTQSYAYGRSQAYIHTDLFQVLTWLRGLGTALFVFGGVFPLVWFMVSRWFQLKPAQTTDEQFVVPRSVLAVAEPMMGGAGLNRAATLSPDRS